MEFGEEEGREGTTHACPPAASPPPRPPLPPRSRLPKQVGCLEKPSSATSPLPPTPPIEEQPSSACKCKSSSTSLPHGRLAILSRATTLRLSALCLGLHPLLLHLLRRGCSGSPLIARGREPLLPLGRTDSLRWRIVAALSHQDLQHPASSGHLVPDPFGRVGRGGGGGGRSSAWPTSPGGCSNNGLSLTTCPSISSTTLTLSSTLRRLRAWRAGGRDWWTG